MRWRPARPPQSPIARAPGSSPVMRVQHATRVTCSWSRPIIATEQRGTYPLTCPTGTPHRGGQRGSHRSRLRPQAVAADTGEVCPHPPKAPLLAVLDAKRDGLMTVIRTYV